MSLTTLPIAPAASLPRRLGIRLVGPLPLVAGWLLLFGPVYVEMATSLWTESVHAHAPLIALIVAALLWQRTAALTLLPAATVLWPGLALLTGGLMLAVLGQAQVIPAIALTAQIPVLAGLLLASKGTPALCTAAFPLAYLAFMIPLPGVVIDALTLPMKGFITLAASELLHLAGYATARSGVILVIGQYQLLIADACAGLQSVVALLALGVLHTHLFAVGARQRAALLLALVPIAVAANLLRVLALALITVHAGDAAGRQWHELAGVFTFAVAWLGLLAVGALGADRSKERTT